MRSKLLPLCMAALLTGAGGLAVADDGTVLQTWPEDVFRGRTPEPLASGEASFITGAALPVDGGYTAK